MMPIEAGFAASSRAKKKKRLTLGATVKTRGCGVLPGYLEDIHSEGATAPLWEAARAVLRCPGLLTIRLPASFPQR
ncbi:hypothetical protein A6D6_04097, partial [Alcanivorax xiamenensis]